MIDGFDDPSVAPVDPANALVDLQPDQIRHLLGMLQGPDSPVPPQGPLPTPAASGGAVDWRKLLEHAGPIVGMMTAGGNGGDHAAFYQGFQKGQALAQQARDTQRVEAEKRGLAGSKWLMDVAGHASQFDDPVQYENYMRLAETAGTKAGFTQPGELRTAAPFPKDRQVKKRLKEVRDKLDTYEKGGYNLDELAASGSVLTLDDGTQVPFASAMRLVRSRPLDASGKTIPRPLKQDVNASSDYGRFLARWAKDHNTTVDQLTADEELSARKEFNTVDDRPANRSDVQAQFDDLVEIWKQTHPGKDIPADVRTILRQRARKEIGQADDRPPISVNVGGSGLSKTQISTAAALRDDFRNETKDYRVSRDAYERLLSSAKDPSPAGDLSLLFAYMRALDPGSVVRESEFAQAARTGSLPVQVQSWANRVLSGERLTAGQRADFVARAKALFDRANARQGKIAAKYRSMAKQSGVPEDLVIVDDADVNAIEDKPAGNGAQKPKDPLGLF